MAPIIGIDLGTTNSLVAVFDSGEPRLIANVHGETITPSIVGIAEGSRVHVGVAAKELRVTRPEMCASCFKRLMGTERRIELGDQDFSPVELSSLVLQSLKSDAEHFLKRTVSDAVITVPAYFNDNQRKATKLAGELAGLHVRRIINEPTAAALTYGFHDRASERKLIIIDLGGGTFDVTTMEVFEGTLEIISSAGECFLGGEDFTDRLASWCLDAQGLQLESAELKLPLLVSRLRQECEYAKRQLLDSRTATIRIPDREGRLTAEARSITVTDEEFADIVKPLVKRLARPIAKAVRDSRIPVKDFTDVILVGGATRMRVVRDFVQEYFGIEPSCDRNPDEVVALGAAVQAALIEDDASVDDLVMTDVCPFTLGVEIIKQFGRHDMSGYYLPVIHRNTTIPVSREEVLSTVQANQREVTIRVYQGESRKVKDNLLLGELRVSGIPPGPEGQPVHVRFTYDLNGILEVEAYLPGTGEKFTTVLTQHVQDLTRKEVKTAVRKMQSLKFYPRDEVANQHLCLYAERVIGEVSSCDRAPLEDAIDQFEDAMARSDRDAFHETRQNLLIVLSSVGFPYQSDSGESAEDDFGT